MIKFFKLFLIPFAVLYAIIVEIRNKLFQIGFFKSQIPEIFSIGIGNLSMGGTGKTPMVSYLIQNLAKHKIAVLSRGYGRKTKGYRQVTDKESVETVGDEVMMLFEKHKSEAQFFVCENRREGIKKIRAEFPDIDLLIFDDIYQHQWVKPHVNILLSTYSDPFFKDYILPFGRLRELRKSALRADMVVITKSPDDLSSNEKTLISGGISPYVLKAVPLYFSKQVLCLPENLFGKQLKMGEKVKVLSALAQNENFQHTIKKDFKIDEAHSFRDHHSFSRKEIERILFSKPALPLITTEKDYIKIKQLLSHSEMEKFYVVKLEIEILNNETAFMNQLIKFFPEHFNK